MRLAIFDNLASKTYIQAQLLHRIGHEGEFLLDPLGGTSALEAMSCRVPLPVALDRDRFAGRFPTPPPVFNVAAPGEIAEDLRRPARDPKLRMSAGADARPWVEAVHATGFGQRAFEICEAVVSEPRASR